MPLELDGVRFRYPNRNLLISQGFVVVNLLKLRAMRKYLDRHLQSGQFTRWALMIEQPEVFQLLINSNPIDHYQTEDDES